MGLPGLHKSDAINTWPRVSIIRVFVDQLSYTRCLFSLTQLNCIEKQSCLCRAAPPFISQSSVTDELRQTANEGALAVRSASRDHPSQLPCRDLATATALHTVHGGYISPFGRHFWNISCSLQATLLPLLSHFLGLLLVCQLLWAARGALDVVTTCAHARCAA